MESTGHQAVSASKLTSMVPEIRIADFFRNSLRPELQLQFAGHLYFLILYYILYINSILSCQGEKRNLSVTL
jgi:hypothetical protein